MNNPDNFLEEFYSNTLAGTCNNFILKAAVSQPKRSRIYYRVVKSGKQSYRFAFANTVDSTYGDGSECHENVSGGEWEICSAAAGDGGVLGEPDNTAVLIPLSFGGKGRKTVAPDELFATDEVLLDIPENHYLCFELTFSGRDIPYTPDKIIPSFSLSGESFCEDKEFPQPVFVGCKGFSGKKTVFLGDSITQGLGTRPDYYEYWAARFGQLAGENCSIWNIGLGCGHASDAATGGCWMQKALAGDTVFVCFGVNDIFMHYPAEKICSDIETVVKRLKDAGKTVILLSVPPFDMEGEDAAKWYAVNDYLRNVLSEQTDGFFDTASVLGREAPLRHCSLYGSHPDGNGGRALGDALYKCFSGFIK